MAIERLTRKQVLMAWLIRIAFLVVALILIDLTPVGGTSTFYGKWISCGQKPVTVRGSGFMNAGTPYYFEPPSFNFFPGVHDYYCTPIEAERAGYSADRNELSFPNLERAGEPIPLGNGVWRYPDGKTKFPDGTILYPDDATEHQ